MKLIIDLSKKENVRLVLKKGEKVKAAYSWPGLYALSETLLAEIDKFLKKNKVKLEEIKEVEVIPSSQSIVSSRIAKATVLGLKSKIDAKH